MIPADGKPPIVDAAAGLIWRAGPVVLNIDIGFENEYAYYHHGLVGTVILSGFTFFWFATVYLLTFLTRDGGVLKAFLKADFPSDSPLSLSSTG